MTHESHGKAAVSMARPRPVVDKICRRSLSGEPSFGVRRSFRRPPCCFGSRSGKVVKNSAFPREPARHGIGSGNISGLPENGIVLLSNRRFEQGDDTLVGLSRKDERAPKRRFGGTHFAFLAALLVTMASGWLALAPLLADSNDRDVSVVVEREGPPVAVAPVASPSATVRATATHCRNLRNLRNLRNTESTGTITSLVPTAFRGESSTDEVVSPGHFEELSWNIARAIAEINEEKEKQLTLLIDASGTLRYTEDHRAED